MDVIPTLRYRDADAAIAFLKDAFGFGEHAVFRDGDEVAHAELTVGDGMVMLGSDREAGADVNAAVGSSSLYCVLDDVAGHYERAVAAGAEIVRELHEAGYGGSGYTALDPEGNRWSFGSYQPA
jgi:uncharacterized glyoxalase superfamily protein PhnB